MIMLIIGEHNLLYCVKIRFLSCAMIFDSKLVEIDILLWCGLIQRISNVNFDFEFSSLF